MIAIFRFPGRPLAFGIIAGLLSIGVAPPVSAGPRPPAPIVFVHNSAPAELAAGATAALTGSRRGADPGAISRTEFRYPDLPDTYFSSEGMRAAGAADPIVFASAEAAISPEQARGFVQSQALQTAPFMLATDPNLSPGAFDARRAAREAALAAAGLPDLPARPAGQPPAAAGIAFSGSPGGFALPDPSPLPATGAGKLYVQLAAFRDITNAERLLRRVQGRLPAEMVPALVDGDHYYRIRVGPISDRGAANSLRDLLAAEGIADGRVVQAP